MKKLNVSRFLLASLVVCVAVFVLEGLIHGWLLHDFYRNPLWRPCDTWIFRQYASLVASAVVFALSFTWIFHFGYEGRKLEGLRYGFYMWLLATVTVTFMWYAVQPVGWVAVWWIVTGFFKMLILGLLVAAVYKPR
ncbi:MAG: hypothetical protein JSV08_08935 [Acidobacteriota bacterium]|nr:MAG: hypothetical protein JSV08_08935 [Acidobacteriota bacterium]